MTQVALFATPGQRLMDCFRLAPVLPSFRLAMNRRSWRLLTVMLSLCALLFAQTAVARYICPELAKAVEVAQMTEAGMPCAESMSQSMDDEQPALCHAHCQSAHGTADSYQPPSLPSLGQLGPVLTLAVIPASRTAPDRPLVQQSVLRAAASPPLAITNCCFRI